MNATSEQRRAKSDISGGAPDAGARVDVRRRLAFSLAEMMIALAILGLGLLFIAAALPAGVSVARESADFAVADAAAEEALDLIEQHIRTSRELMYPRVDYTADQYARADDLFTPRMVRGGAAFFQRPRRDDFEPFIKVRPFELSSIEYRVNNQNRTAPFVDFSEFVIERFHRTNNLFAAAQPAVEFDSGFQLPTNRRLLLADNPILSPLARVYPPVTPIRPMLVDEYFRDQPNYYQYKSRQGSGLGVYSAELEKAQSRRIAWTAFYRRVSYDAIVGPGPDNTFGTPDDIRSARDPHIYEIIVVVTRRPTDTHRFPTQNPTPNNFTELPQATNVDRLAPMPWLVTFASDMPVENSIMQDLNRATGWGINGPDNFDDSVGSNRSLASDFSQRANFVFRTQRDPATNRYPVGELLPVGSIIIPAANDDFPTTRNIAPWEPPGNPSNPPSPTKRLSGFAPHMPNTLPIYEVIERPDNNTIICKNNGAHPWVARGLTARAFPCWVIPPSFVERDGNGQPVYDRRSPVLSVHRRLIRIPELP